MSDLTEEFMRNLIASLMVVGLFATPASAGQARSGGGAAGKPAIKACSLLTKELVMQVSGAVNKAMFDLPPEEEPVGNGSACEYADIRLQIDPFAWTVLEESAKKDKTWVPLSGIGDGAYFQAGRSFAGLMGHVGGRTFTIQMGVPSQSTAEQIKPNVITLANAIVPKLK
jgi:hypothetical protein